MNVTKLIERQCERQRRRIAQRGYSEIQVGPMPGDDSFVAAWINDAESINTTFGFVDDDDYLDRRIDAACKALRARDVASKATAKAFWDWAVAERDRVAAYYLAMFQR